MTVATGYRPRPWEHHLRLASALSRAPARVAVTHADDGWTCAHLAVCGRAPIWASAADRRPAERALVRLGLPGIRAGHADARLGHDLRLRGGGSAQRIGGTQDAPLDIVTTVGGPWQQVRDRLRTLLGRGRVTVVDRTGCAEVRTILERLPGVRVIYSPGSSPGAALAEALAHVSHDEVLFVPEHTLLLPGTVAVLRRALLRHAGPGVAVGDQVLLDPRGALPTGLHIAPRHPAEQGRRIAEGLGDDLPPVLISKALLEGHLAPLRDEEEGATARWFAERAASAPTFVVPLWTAGRTRGLSPRRSAPRARTRLAVLPEDAGMYVVIDDGEEGSLGETLARLPKGARTTVLRAVPDAVDANPSAGGVRIGGFGDVDALPDGPWHLRLTSDPEWTPPVLTEPELLQSMPAVLPSAAGVLAAVLDWPSPTRRRAAGRARIDPVVHLARDARDAWNQGDRALAFTLGRALCGATGGWSGAERFLHLVQGMTAS